MDANEMDALLNSLNPKVVQEPTPTTPAAATTPVPSTTGSRKRKHGDGGRSKGESLKKRMARLQALIKAAGEEDDETPAAAPSTADEASSTASTSKSTEVSAEKRKQKNACSKNRRALAKTHLSQYVNAENSKMGEFVDTKDFSRWVRTRYTLAKDMDLSGDDEETRRGSAFHPEDRYGVRGNRTAAKVVSLLDKRNDALTVKDEKDQTRTCRACLTSEFTDAPEDCKLPKCKLGAYLSDGESVAIRRTACCRRAMCAPCIYRLAETCHYKGQQLSKFFMYLRCPCCGQLDTACPDVNTMIEDNKKRPGRWLATYWLARTLYVKQGAFCVDIEKWLEEENYKTDVLAVMEAKTEMHKRLRVPSCGYITNSVCADSNYYPSGLYHNQSINRPCRCGVGDYGPPQETVSHLPEDHNHYTKTLYHNHCG